MCLWVGESENEREIIVEKELHKPHITQTHMLGWEHIQYSTNTHTCGLYSQVSDETLRIYCRSCDDGFVSVMIAD